MSVSIAIIPAITLSEIRERVSLCEDDHREWARLLRRLDREASRMLEGLAGDFSMQTRALDEWCGPGRKFWERASAGHPATGRERSLPVKGRSRSSDAALSTTRLVLRRALVSNQELISLCQGCERDEPDATLRELYRMIESDGRRNIGLLQKFLARNQRQLDLGANLKAVTSTSPDR